MLSVSSMGLSTYVCGTGADGSALLRLAGYVVNGLWAWASPFGGVA